MEPRSLSSCGPSQEGDAIDKEEEEAEEKTGAMSPAY